jgi:hypothetical protein
MNELQIFFVRASLCFEMLYFHRFFKKGTFSKLLQSDSEARVYIFHHS